MSRYLLIFILLVSNTYANKNWIELDSSDKNKTQNSTDLKMFDTKSSLDKIGNLNNSHIQTKKRSPDRDLIELFKQVQNMTQKIQSKIKK